MTDTAAGMVDRYCIRNGEWCCEGCGAVAVTKRLLIPDTAPAHRNIHCNRNSKSSCKCFETATATSQLPHRKQSQSSVHRNSHRNLNSKSSCNCFCNCQCICFESETATITGTLLETVAESVAAENNGTGAVNELVNGAMRSAGTVAVSCAVAYSGHWFRSLEQIL